MFLVSHDIYCSFCPSPCFTNWFPLTWGDSTISGNTETRNSFFFQFAGVFFCGLSVLRPKKKKLLRQFFSLQCFQVKD